MNLLIETFLAEDITGNRYSIERYQVIKKVGTKLTRTDQLLYRNTPVSLVEDDIYYIESLDTEVKRINS